MKQTRVFSILIAGLVCVCMAGCGQKCPITTSFRQSQIDSSGLVLQVHNTGNELLSCAIHAENQQLNESMNYAFYLSPHAMTEIGLLETGWTFKAGETVLFTINGYRDSYVIRVP